MAWEEGKHNPENQREEKQQARENKYKKQTNYTVTALEEI